MWYSKLFIASSSDFWYVEMVQVRSQVIAVEDALSEMSLIVIGTLWDL